MNDQGTDPLEPVDVAPRRLPGTKVTRQAVDGRRELAQQPLGLRHTGFGGRVPTPSATATARRGVEDTQRRRNRGHAPPVIPVSEEIDRLTQLRLQRMVRW